MQDRERVPSPSIVDSLKKIRPFVLGGIAGLALGVAGTWVVTEQLENNDHEIKNYQVLKQEPVARIQGDTADALVQNLDLVLNNMLTGGRGSYQEVPRSPTVQLGTFSVTKEIDGKKVITTYELNKASGDFRSINRQIAIHNSTEKLGMVEFYDLRQFYNRDVDIQTNSNRAEGPGYWEHLAETVVNDFNLSVEQFNEANKDRLVNWWQQKTSK
ncbi:MAG TPA: hypothetical protein VLE91_04820 [Candidatus Saccharimonadales bacterium]|nr:hypothetical protein [Candidatus Saccharimonadales bacterium]